ncbi:MAG: hypothetical protein R3F55_03465 [Alphaproteobacteria bacterium]
MHVLGDSVALNAGADVDVSGPAGGGEALIGGGFASGAAAPGAGLQYVRDGEVTTIVADPGFAAGGYLPSASIAYVDAGASVHADATDSGDGGAVAVWARDEVRFHGLLSVQGGASGGNGGLVEVSTAGGGVIDGTALAGAAAGNGGQFLIDPQNVCVAAAGNCGFGAGFLLITPTTIQNFFAGTPGGTFEVRTDLANPAGNEGDIIIANSLNIVATGSGSLLRFLAHDDISLNGAVNIFNSGAALNIEMIAEAFGGTPDVQQIFIDGDITTNGGTFLASAETFITDNDDDTISTGGGDVTILANVLTFAQSNTLNPGEIVINAGSGKVQFDRVDPGEFSLGDDNGGTHLSQAEIRAIRAGVLVVGEGGGDQIANHDVQVNLINVANVNTNLSSAISGQVRLYALEGNNGDVEFSGANTFVSLAAFADDNVLLLDDGIISITGGVGAIAALAAGDNIELRARTLVTTNGGAVSLGAGTNESTDTVLLDGDVTTNGGRFSSVSRDFIIDDDGDTLSTAGGKVEIQTDSIDIDSNNAAVAAIDAGNGSVYFYRTTPGTVGLGQAAGQFQLTQGEIDQINAHDLTIGDPDNGIVGDDLNGHSNQITDIALLNVDFTDNGANDQGISTLVRLFALRAPESADITMTGNIIVPQLRAQANDQVIVNASGNLNPALLSELGTIHLIAQAGATQPGLTINGAITAATNFHADSQQVSLDANIIAPGGITGSAQLVTVVGATNGAQINDALGMITTSATPGSPAHVNVGDGIYNEAVVVTKNNVVLTGGLGAIVQPASPGFTINATGVTIDGFSYSGTGGDSAILLTGAADDVIIRNGAITGTSGAAAAGIEVDVTVTAALDLTVDNVTMTGVSGFGIRIDPALNGANIAITGSTVAGAADGIRFANITDSTVSIGGLLLGDGNSITGGGTGIATGSISGGSFVVAGNSLVRGSSGFVFGALSNNALVAIVNNNEIRGTVVDGIGILQVTDSTVAIAGNAGIFGNDDGIFVSNAIANSSFTVGSTNVTIGGTPTAFVGNGTIQGQNDGFDIDRIDNSVFRVADNTLIRGVNGDGFEFDNLIQNGASIEIVGNDEVRGGTRAIHFEQAITDSSVTIAGNTTMLGDANDGIRFSGTLTGDTVLIGGLAGSDANSIRGAQGGIFAGNIAGGSFLVIGNTLVRGDTQEGILTGVLSAGLTFGIAGNSEIRGGIDAIGIGQVVGSSTVAIADNFLIEGESGDGVFVSTDITDSVFRVGSATLTVGGIPTLFGGNGTIRGHENAFDIDQIVNSTFAITNNALVQGVTQEAIQFDNTIGGGANIEVRSNTTVHGATDGIAFQQTVTDSTVTIAGNVIAGDSENGIRFAAALTGDTVLIGGLGAGDANNIAGGKVGLVTGNIDGGSFVVAGNALIKGTLFSGIQIGALSNGLLFGIVGNTEIRGVGLDGIDVLQVNGSTVAIAGNDGIFGDADDGIFIGNGVFDSTFIVGTATVDVAGTPTVFGGNGQIVARNDGMDIDRIDNSTFRIADNTLIRGTAGEGLEFDNTIQNGAVVEVAGNVDILGATSGIAFQASITGGSVLIDRNGTADQNGAPYDGTAPVDLATFVPTGSIAGASGAAVSFSDIAGDAAVTVSRNILTGSQIGVLFGTVSSTGTTAVHNNFVLNNLFDGLRFEGNVTGRVEVFQNFIADNIDDGIEISVGADVGAGNLVIQQNFLPGAGFLNGNGGFAVKHGGTGTIDIEGNWWGSIAAADIATVLDNVPLPALVVATGDDTNVPGVLGVTGLDPFAFQNAVLVGPFVPGGGEVLGFLAQALLVGVLEQSSGEATPGDRVAGRAGPDAGNVFTNVFGEAYSLFGEGSLADLAPAAGGEACTLSPVEGGVSLGCGAGGGGGGTGEGGLPNLEPAAGGAPAIDPGLNLQDLLNMWLFNFGTPLDGPVAGLDGAAAEEGA